MQNRNDRFVQRVNCTRAKARAAGNASPMTSPSLHAPRRTKLVETKHVHIKGIARSTTAENLIRRYRRLFTYFEFRAKKFVGEAGADLARYRDAVEIGYLRNGWQNGGRSAVVDFDSVASCRVASRRGRRLFLLAHPFPTVPLLLREKEKRV